MNLRVWPCIDSAGVKSYSSHECLIHFICQTERKPVSDRNSHVEITINSERQFGLVFAGVFVIVALWPVWHGNALWWWALPLAAMCAMLAFVAPKALYWPNVVWFKFGQLLAAVLNPLMMAAVFIVAVVPTALIMRLMGKDPLRQKPEKDAATYWIKKDKTYQSKMQNQF